MARLKERAHSGSAELEKRIQILEEIEALKKMKAEYVLSCDQRRWDDAMSYFSSDAIVDFGPFGRFETRAELEKFFKETMPVTIAFTVHRLSNPIIEVNGDTAKGIWYCEIPSTHIPSNKAIVQEGVYEDEYVKEGNAWKHSLLKLTYSYITEFGEGWVKKNMASKL